MKKVQKKTHSGIPRRVPLSSGFGNREGVIPGKIFPPAGTKGKVPAGRVGKLLFDREI